ncbi:TPA: Ig-like domain-containing protein, partial [Klebsiella pneumoniae]
ATNKKVTWASKNAEFATVDAATGLVTGVAEGTATIEVTTADGSHKATATVQVTAAAA